MTFLDRVILSLNPVAGERRISARARAATVMNYDAATKGRRSYGWKAPATSADSAAYGSRAQLRNLSRDMDRNRAFAARARMVVTTNVVGTGIVPSVEIVGGLQGAAADTLRAQVQGVIDAHLMTRAIDAHGRHNLLQLQAIVMNAVFTDGEVLVRRRMRKGRFANGMELPFQVQLMEADHLDTTKTKHGENDVIEGVEYGPTGQIVAYHLFDQHPGDASWWSHRRLESRRVPESEILHIYRADRPGQHRGVPWLAPVMMTLGEISDYQEAQILKQRMAALLAGVVESDIDGEEWQGQGLDELAPGALVGLKNGQKVSFTQPPSVDGYDDFMRKALAAIGMGVGITYEALSGDLRRVNFSSGRMGRMEMDRLVQSWQEMVMIGQFCEGIGRWFAEGWKLVPRLGPPVFNLDWTAPRRALIEPAREIPAMVAEIEAGLTSIQRVQRTLGYNPETIRRERAEDAAADLPGPGAGVPAAQNTVTQNQAADDAAAVDEEDPNDA
jgi:lambda family phage portal protein